MKVWDITKAGTWQGPERFSTGVGVFNPSHKGTIHNPPVTTGGIAGTVKTEIGGLHGGKPLCKKKGVIISGVTSEIEQQRWRQLPNACRSTYNVGNL